MGALKENIRKSMIATKKFWQEVWQACTELVGVMLGEEEEMYDADLSKVAVEGAINEVIQENPEMSEELNKARQAIRYEQEKLDEQAEKQFNSENIFGNDFSGKDEDGYHKIEDKVTKHIKAEVSEEQARKDSAQRSAKGGKPRTRVDED